MTCSSDTEDARKSRWPLFISIGLLAALLACYLLMPDVHHFVTTAINILSSGNEQQVKRWIGQFGYRGPLAIILAMVVQMFLIIIPSPVLIAVAVLAYGAIWGSIIAIMAIFCASSVGYGIGAYFGPPLVTKMLGKASQQKVAKAIDRYGFWAVVVTRLNPFLSDDAISFVGGMLEIGYWRFIGATLIGITPLTLFIAYIGENTDQLKNSFLWVGIASLFLLGLYIWWDKKRGKN